MRHLALSKKHIVFFLLLISTHASASDFSLPFVNGSELGNMYSGVAASAVDASTTYTNPAGLIKLPSPQMVLAGVGVKGNVQFEGTATTPTTSQSGTANGTMGGLIPLFYYAHPLSQKMTFGVGLNAPFGLGTNYPKDSLVRYSATRSKIVVTDLSPSLGYKVSDQLSLGIGLDIEQLQLTLQNMLGPPFSTPDAETQNYVKGWGYGFHTGLLGQINPKTRFGLTFHSQVMFHASGYSQIFSSTSGNYRNYQRANAAMPALTQLSITHEVNPKWETMATVSYTHWSTLNQVTLKNSVLPGGSTTAATIPFEYHNTLDYAAGLNFKATDKWTLRTGAQYLNTPSNNRDRSVVDPLGNAILIALGAHYQQNAKLSYDIAYAHNFCQTMHINTVAPTNSAIGHESLSPNILGAQVTWNL